MQRQNKQYPLSLCKDFLFTNDHNIRIALKKYIKEFYSNFPNTKIIEEFGVAHGAVRVDITIINGIMHGFEIKSDRDTLGRLPEQMDEFNSVFDKMTLVVGNRHLYNAINLIPDWWGIMVAKINKKSDIVFHTVREADDNKGQIGISIARLLWREEALRILENQSEADGIRSKPRKIIYERLANSLKLDELKEQVRRTLLISRKDWRSDVQLMLNDD